MTASDIIRIISTVAMTQAVCDILANKFVFSTKTYRQLVNQLERCREKRDKILASPPPAVSAQTNRNSNSNSNGNSKARIKSVDKYSKKLQRAEDDYGEAKSNVAKKHSGPQIINSVIFIILYRVLNIEYKGKVIALVPYEPWGLLQRCTMRGLAFDPNVALSFMAQGADPSRRVFSTNQACGFLFIYLLCTMSVKFAVNKVLGKKPPVGADKGFMTFVDDPRGQKILENLGMEKDEINEIKKML